MGQIIGGSGGGGSSYTDADAILATLGDGTENYIPKFGASGTGLADSRAFEVSGSKIVITSPGTAIGIADRAGLLNLEAILGEDLKIKFNLGVDQEAGLFFETTEPTTGSIRYAGTGFRFMPSGTTQTVKFYTDGNVGFGDMVVPTYALSFSGQAAKTIGLERHTTSNTAGNNLTVLSGGATSGATNKNGGDLYLSSGTSTGTGTSNIYFQTVTTGSSGTASTSASTKMTILGSGNVGIGVSTPTTILSFSGQLANVIGMERHTTSDTAGNNLTVKAGGCYTTGVSKNGGDLYLQSGQSTGTGTSNIFFQLPTTNGTATADGTYTTRMTMLSSGNIGIGGTPTDRLEIFTSNAVSKFKFGHSITNIFGAATNAGFQISRTDGDYSVGHGLFDQGYFLVTLARNGMKFTSQYTDSNPYIRYDFNGILTTYHFATNSDTHDMDSSFYRIRQTAAAGAKYAFNVQQTKASGNGSDAVGIKVDVTGASPGNNTGLSITVSGASTTNYGIITTAVNSGFGITDPTALIHIGASTTARASLCVPHGTAPTTPVDGDFWTDTGGAYVRINGVTKTFTLT